MKKIKFLALFLLIIPIFLCGCEISNELKVVSIEETTLAGSKDYGVRFAFQDDKRLEGKSYDIQVMSSESDVEVTIAKELGEKFSYKITNPSRWLSFTMMKVESENKSGTEKFSKLEEAIDTTYIINVNKPCNLIFRVVAGDSLENSSGKGEILAYSQPISDEFILECKKV